MDLDLIPTEALIKALRGRALCFVFGHIVQSEDTRSREEYFFDWSGSMFTCLGLIEAIRDDVRARVREVEAQPSPPES